jgi:hypothetical protein
MRTDACNRRTRRLATATWPTFIDVMAREQRWISGCDALRVKIRDAGLVKNKAVYTALAFNLLGRATELGPNQVRYAYVYAVALHSAGRRNEAVTVLKDGLAKHRTPRKSRFSRLA